MNPKPKVKSVVGQICRAFIFATVILASNARASISQSPLGLEIEDPALWAQTLYLVDDQNAVALSFVPNDFPRESPRRQIANRFLPRGKFQILVEGKGTLARVDLGPSCLLFAVGGKDSTLGPVFETLSKYLPWGSLNTFGTYGRFFNPRSLGDLPRRTRGADGALLFVQGHLEGDALVVGEHRLRLSDLGPTRGKTALFLISDGVGSSAPDLSPYFDHHGFFDNASNLSSQCADFFEGHRGMNSNKTWQTLGDLCTFLAPEKRNLGPSMAGMFLRWCRFTPAQRTTTVVTTAVYSEITNGGRASELMRNGVMYQIREEAEVKRVQTGVLTTTNTLETPARWEDPPSGF